MTDRIAEIRARLEATTPGPWEFSDSTDVRGNKGEFRAPSPYNGFMLVGPWTNDADAALIVLLRNHAADLIAVCDAVKVTWDICPGEVRDAMKSLLEERALLPLLADTTEAE